MSRNFLTRLILRFKKARFIAVAGRGKETAAEAIFQVLKKHFKVAKVLDGKLGMSDILKNEILILDTIPKDILPLVLVVTHVGEYHPEKEFFAGELKDTMLVRTIAKILPVNSYLVLNYDDETVREISELTGARILTFGLGARADFQASDILINQERANFKVNYKGKIVPFWLKNLSGREHIYAALAAAACGVIMELNLVEISRALEN